MARAHPDFALRPLLPTDPPLLVAIFQSSIEELTGDDYTAAQQQAWAAMADDDEGFASRLAGGLTLVATMNGSPVGFAAMQGNQQIDMLYVHPAMSGQGVGSMLLDALERLAVARGATRLTADASDTARPFFERRGFVSRQRNSVSCGREWLVNTTMEKKLIAQGGNP
jgi:putative acetyltransferase